MKKTYQEIRMDGTVGGGKITLDAMPTEKYGKPYPPKTKIIIERYLTKAFTDTPKRYDYIVRQDTVEVYQGYPKLCNHAIEPYDPTIVLMDLHCDNISWTHELHDVTLNYKTTQEEPENIDKRGKKLEKDIGNCAIKAFDRPYLGIEGSFTTSWLDSYLIWDYYYTENQEANAISFKAYITKFRINTSIIC